MAFRFATTSGLALAAALFAAGATKAQSFLKLNIDVIRGFKLYAFSFKLKKYA